MPGGIDRQAIIPVGEVFGFMKNMIAFTMVLWISFSIAPFIHGQDFTASSESAAAGGSVNITTTLDNTGEGPIQGWSFGLCHDSAAATVTAIHQEQSSDVDFNQTSIYPDGWTQGVVISFTGANPIESGATGFTMASADYDVSGDASPGDYALDFCETLGSPAVTTVAVVGGASIPPDMNSGNIEVIEVPGPEYTYNAPDRTVNYNPDDGSASFTESIEVSETDNSAAGAPFPNTTQGFSMGLGHDATLLDATSVTLAGPVAALDGGNGPGFAESSLYSDGWTLGIVYSFVGSETISFDASATVAEITYQTNADTLAENETGTTTTLSWIDTLGSPAVTNVMVVGGSSIGATPNNGAISLEPVSVTPFLRSDANGDGRSDVADAIWMLTEQFLNGPANNCAGAKDANHDGSFNVADPTWVINYQFTDGAPPPAPFPDCGISANQTPEDCLEYSGCG
jgi:hypothetical protein